MSPAPFSRSPDLKRLRDEGYFVQICGGLLVMRDVPYVDARKQVRTGTLISSLNLAGEETRTPDTHVIHFDGAFPCKPDGTPIQVSRIRAATSILAMASRRSTASRANPMVATSTTTTR